MPFARLKKTFLPISWYLILFMLAAMLTAGVSAYFSAQQADAIQHQAREQTTKRAHEELLREVEHLGKELSEVAEYLAGWDETLALFRDANYYNYWKETRVKDAARYRGLIDAVDLYAANGKPLSADATLAPKVYSTAIRQPVLLRKGPTVYIVYFHPVEALASMRSGLLGYVGMRMRADKALESSDTLGRSSIQHVEWHLPDGVVTPLADGVKAAELQVSPSPEIDAFSHLVRKGFMQYLAYTAGLLALLALLLTFSIARPLRRLAGYLREIHSGNTDAIPEDLHGAVNIRELENVRRALNDYKDRLLSAAATLEEKNRELMHLTYHDPLTGRYNRRAFEARLQHAIETAVVEGKQHALCYIDVDQFKVVNDTCGHVAGDELLKQVAALLERDIREADMLARLGGDEFGVLLEGCGLERAAEHAETMRLRVRKHRFVWQDKPFDISISIGLVPITAECASMEEVMKNADAACYVAKDSGRNRLQIYQQHDKEMAQRYGEMQWVSRIQQALEENRFELHGQLIRPTTGKTHTPHYEVLIRLRDPNGQLVPPMAFIPAAERYNLMSSIDQWVVRHALEMVAARQAMGRGEDISLAINLSGQSLGNEEVLASIRRAIAETGVAPASLCFEITETAAITNLAAASRFMRQLRALGCRFSLDDFGSGLSSFGYLNNLQVDYIKIDGHFVKHILSDPLSRSIIDAINRIGHVLGISTVAEFVETEEIAAALQKLGIDYVQGFGVHKPEPLTALLSVRQPLKSRAQAAN
ncbi:MAG: EAL domain-containing protein [Gammaproteobacteria bacterium]|nr:EAL domain-containing protein [Gammaproteobacteria bacterium]